MWNIPKGTPSGGSAKCFVYVKEGQTIVVVAAAVCVCGVCNAHVASSCWQPVHFGFFLNVAGHEFIWEYFHRDSSSPSSLLFIFSRFDFNEMCLISSARTKLQLPRAFRWCASKSFVAKVLPATTNVEYKVLWIYTSSRKVHKERCFQIFRRYLYIRNRITKAQIHLLKFLNPLPIVQMSPRIEWKVSQVVWLNIYNILLYNFYTNLWYSNLLSK